ncbi:ABC transporter ATP-binding protein [Actinoplanes siamensis]|uniref:ABC transporter ATP-binding protein n=1 Tax=Actinoplanes siamensis TaxID=1223317 RepID=A0A919N8M5_9ACTN|nr:ABC transporter ATP-binding protein [Actinoplanes siamensis]GIF06331.1 ABC transporter ATP-binding protein [Actinoplanes siamensis]
MSTKTPVPELVLDQITVRFGGLVALDDVSLRVPAGRIVGVIGPNGAGKTTLFNVICGFVTPSAGQISLGGRSWKPRPHRLNRLGIARTLQGVGQFGGLTVLENVLVGARGFRSGEEPAGRGWPAGRARQSEQDALAALERCGVAEYAHAYPGTLPYAVRKRIELARALAARPRILMLDEPAGGLDTDEIHWLAGLIKTAGTTVLLVEHHMDLVMSVCDEILVLDFGKPIALGTPAGIRANEKVTEAYLGTAA